MFTKLFNPAVDENVVSFQFDNTKDKFNIFRDI